MPRRELRMCLREPYARFPSLFPRNADGSLCRLSDDGSQVVVVGRADITDEEWSRIRFAIQLAHPRVPIDRLPRRRNADRRLVPII